jgi:hypothetical protein
MPATATSKTSGISLAVAWTATSLPDELAMVRSIRAEGIAQACRGDEAQARRRRSRYRLRKQIVEPHSGAGLRDRAGAARRFGSPNVPSATAIATRCGTRVDPQTGVVQFESGMTVWLMC